ncbi:unnamed protein product [Gadus morhua 'NCC']
MYTEETDVHNSTTGYEKRHPPANTRPHLQLAPSPPYPGALSLRLLARPQSPALARPHPGPAQAHVHRGPRPAHLLSPHPPLPPGAKGKAPLLPHHPTHRLPPGGPTATPGPSSSPSPLATSFAPFAASTSSSSSSSSSHGNPALCAKAAGGLTNGNAKPVSTATSGPITPFHTPASPAGRQGPQTNPMGIPGLVRANQSPAPVRQGVSQQALLLGKSLKGSGQDQVLLRAQMLILTSAMRPVSSSATSSSASCSSSFSSSSSHPASAQLQSLTLRPPPLGPSASPPSLP